MEVEKALDQLPKLSTDEMLQRFRAGILVDEDVGELKIKQYNENVNGFVRECRDMLDHMKRFKKAIKAVVPVKNHELQFFRDLGGFLGRYEQTILNSEPLFRQESLNMYVDNSRNSFVHLRNWVKGEIMELLALLECISRKEGIDAAKNRDQARLRDSRETAEKMSAGKFTFKGIFKSQGEKASEAQNILSTISQQEKDLVNYDVMRAFLIVYLQEVAVPAFKHNKMRSYMKVMHNFSS